jgi:hypothetical protein
MSMRMSATEWRAPSNESLIRRRGLGWRDRNELGKRVAITPGMAVNAEIITSDRRVIDYVLSPKLRYRHERGRER